MVDGKALLKNNYTCLSFTCNYIVKEVCGDQRRGGKRIMMPITWFKDPALSSDESQMKKIDELQMERLKIVIEKIEKRQQEKLEYENEEQFIESPEKIVEKKKTISFWWFIIDIALLLSGNFIPFFLLLIWLLYRAGKQQPSTQTSGYSTQPTKYTFPEYEKYNEISSYKVGDTNIVKTEKYAFAEIDEMDGFKFEKYMKHVFESLGYSVHHTPLSGDQGADLILTSNEGTKTAVQVKRYSSKVSNGAVQEVVAAKGLYKCTQGMVVTNNYFTDSAKQLAKANGIELIDRNELKKLINKISHNIYQDHEWVQHFYRSSSLLSTYFPTMAALNNLNYTTLENFKKEIYNVMDENSQYSTSPRLINARKEWGAALLDFNSMGVYAISNGNLTSETSRNLREFLESGLSHLNKTITAINIAALNDLNKKEERYVEEKNSIPFPYEIK